MQKNGKINDISEELMNEIPKLSDRKLITIKFLNGAKNLHPDSEEREKLPVIFPKTCITLKDRIKDPYKTGRENMVDIGVWYEEDEKGKPKSYRTILPWAGQSPFRGTYHLVDGRGDDNEIFEHLWLRNDNGSNPHRNPNVPAVYEIVDVEKAAKKTIKDTSILLKSLTIAEGMDLREKKEVAASLNWPFELTDEMLTAKILELAQGDPAAFVKIAVDPETKTKALIKNASDNNIIKYDPATAKVLYSKTDIVLAVLDKRPGVLWLDVFAEYIKKHKDGAKIFESIKKQSKVTTTAEVE